MGAAALAFPDNLSLVTLAGPKLPAWADLLQLPQRAAHIAYKADTPSERNLLAARLDAEVSREDRAVLLVAEGPSCFATAWWARLSPASYVSRVAGALFFRPVEEEETANVDGPGHMFASPRTALPFPSIVLGADTARADLLPQIRTLARNWGSRVVVDRHSDPGPLRHTMRAIERFTLVIVENKVRAAQGLIGLSHS